MLLKNKKNCVAKIIVVFEKSCRCVKWCANSLKSSLLFQFYDIDAVKQRERNPNVIVLITRGLPKDRDHAISEARMLESRDVRLISIGLHSGTISKHLEFFLRDMSFPKYTFYHEYKTLKKNREAILDAMCVKASNVPSAGCKCPLLF